MSEKIIIQNDSQSYTLSGAMDLVAAVIVQGKVSKHTYGESYCFATVFNDNTSVYCELRKTGTVKFTVADF